MTQPSAAAPVTHARHPPRIKLSEQPEEVCRELVVNTAHDVFMRRDAGGRTTCLGFQTHFQRKLMRKFGLEREVILDVCDALELNGVGGKRGLGCGQTFFIKILPVNSVTTTSFD